MTVPIFTKCQIRRTFTKFYLPSSYFPSNQQHTSVSTVEHTSFNDAYIVGIRTLSTTELNEMDLDNASREEKHNFRYIECLIEEYSIDEIATELFRFSLQEYFIVLIVQNEKKYLSAINKHNFNESLIVL